MIFTIIAILCSILITFVICYIFPKGKIKEQNLQLNIKEQQLELLIKDKENEYNNHINQFTIEQQKQNKILQDNIRQWEKEQSDKNLNFLKAQQDLKLTITELEGQKATINKELENKRNEIQDLDGQMQEASKIVETQVIEKASSVIELKEKDLLTQYEKLESKLLLHYTELADTEMNKYLSQAEQLSNAILSKENELKELRAKAAAITNANKRAELEKQKKDFYRLQLSDIDIEEIQRIRSIEPYLRKKEPLNKVIWKVYYEKPYTDLVGRVIGTGVHIGIYKITNLKNGMVYVGQSNNIADRWKQHIKRGIGADPPTQNKLYPAMLEIGVENFTFEILEECPISSLNEREKFYQSVYGAQEFGYSIR